MKMLLTDAPFEFDPPADVETVVIDESRPIPAEHLDAEAAVVMGWTSPAVQQLAHHAPSLRWVQTLAAGPDGVLAAGFGPEVTITNGRGLHDKTVAETAVALALASVRNFQPLLAAQAEHRWAHEEYGTWRPLHSEARLGSLIDTRVLIWGFGAIGQQAARVFSAFSVRQVRGVANTAGERAGFEVFTVDDLPRLLPETDILVMVLPSTPETARILNAERIAMLPHHALVVNVGRGSTIDSDALADALHAGTLGGAALDVVDREPYPADGVLWDAPNTIVLPHVAGGVAHGSDELINENLVRLRAGEPLRNAVAR